MFAIFFTDAFKVFVNNIVAFPTVIFTALMLFLTLYWLTALLGIVDIDSFDIDAPDAFDIGDMGSDMGVDVAGDDLSFVTGLLLKLGWYGIPFMIIITIFTLIAWVLSYLTASYAATVFDTGILYYLITVAILLVTMVLSAVMTGWIISPFRKMVANMPKRTAKSILGQVAVVRSSVVNESYGEAVLEDGGAGLVLKVRAFDATFKQGDKVVLLDYVETENSYNVVSESEFING